MAISQNLPQSYDVDMKLDVVYKGKTKKISLADYDNKYIVLVFYPYDFTTVCPTELNTISDNKDVFDKLDAAVFFISCDSVYCHNAWLNTDRSQSGIKGCEWPLISDYDRALTNYFNIAEPKGHCARATVILDKNRNVIHFSVYDKRMGRSVEEITRTIEMMQMIEKKGEMCGCNWKK